MAPSSFEVDPIAHAGAAAAVLREPVVQNEAEKQMMVWKVWEDMGLGGSNRFLCGGRCITGPSMVGLRERTSRAQVLKMERPGRPGSSHGPDEDGEPEGRAVHFSAPSMPAPAPDHEIARPTGSSSSQDVFQAEVPSDDIFDVLHESSRGSHPLKPDQVWQTLQLTSDDLEAALTEEDVMRIFDTALEAAAEAPHSQISQAPLKTAPSKVPSVAEAAVECIYVSCAGSRGFNGCYDWDGMRHGQPRYRKRSGRETIGYCSQRRIWQFCEDYDDERIHYWALCQAPRSHPPLTGWERLDGLPPLPVLTIEAEVVNFEPVYDALELEFHDRTAAVTTSSSILEAHRMPAGEALCGHAGTSLLHGAAQSMLFQSCTSGGVSKAVSRDLSRLLPSRNVAEAVAEGLTEPPKLILTGL